MRVRFFFRGFVLMFLCVVIAGAAPLPVDAKGLVPCGQTSDDGATSIREDAPCTLCHLVVGGKGIIDYGLGLMTYAAIAVIVAMAILYIVSTGNQGLMETAKKGIFAALIGFGVMLGAWLLVNTMLRLLSVNTIEGLQRDRSMFGFTCSLQSQAGTASGVTTPGGTIGGGTGGSGSGGSGSGVPGKCQAVTSGPCSVANLRNTCFGNNAEMASAICMKESGGNPTIASGVDLCQPGEESVSFGLFQINISANDIGGLVCKAPNGAFDRVYTGKNHVCSVINQARYQECRAKATDIATNIQKACELSGNGARWGAWGANKDCGFPR